MFQVQRLTILLLLWASSSSSLSQSAFDLDENSNPLERTKFDDDLRDFVEFLKLQMQCGYEPVGVPPLAPYRTEFKNFDIQGSTWGFKGNFSDLIVHGLNEFDGLDLRWNNFLQKLTYDFKFPSILAESFYKLESFTGIFGTPLNFHGNGRFHLELVNLRAHGSFKLRPSLSGGLAVWSFKVKLDLDTSHSKTTGIAGSLVYTKLFNGWLEEFIRLTFAEDNAENVSASVEHLVVPPLNKALKNVSLVELIALIMGLAQDVIPNEAIC